MLSEAQVPTAAAAAVQAKAPQATGSPGREVFRKAPEFEMSSSPRAKLMQSTQAVTSNHRLLLGCTLPVRYRLDCAQMLADLGVPSFGGTDKIPDFAKRPRDALQLLDSSLALSGSTCAQLSVCTTIIHEIKPSAGFDARK